MRVVRRRSRAGDVVSIHVRMETLINYLAEHLWLVPFAGFVVFMLPLLVFVPLLFVLSYLFAWRSKASHVSRREDWLERALGALIFPIFLLCVAMSGVLMWMAVARGTDWGGDHGVLLGMGVAGTLVAFWGIGFLAFRTD